MDTSFARPWLRLEGLVVLAAAIFAYRYSGLSWLWFAVLFLAPDLGMLGYAVNARLGALVYNLAHFYGLALSLVVVGVAADHHVLSGLGLIWCAHIGFDRMLGYGLKSSEGFGVTHLGRKGPNRNQDGREA